MEGVHSYEERSTSDQDEINFQKNRIIISNRRDKQVKQDSSFSSNEWITSKYTLISFLPKNLFEQFRRLANFYFLATVILQLALPFSPVGPTTSFLPLLFVVSTTAFKQAYEDYLRHKLDKEVNNRSCYVLQDKKLTKVKSKDIQVGDIVYVKNNEEIPCDMVLLATSGLGDRCYVTTANLDGETSLKSRSCFQIREKLGSIEELDKTLLIVECEKPNATLYEFNGFLRAPTSDRSHVRLMKNDESSQKTTSTLAYSIFKQIRKSKARSKRKSKRTKQQELANRILNTLNVDSFHDIPLTISNILLRASRLRNTSHVYGLAVYTGQDTKLAHNSHVKANKFSSIERRVNLFLFIDFGLLIIFTLCSSLNYKKPAWRTLNETNSFAQIFMAHFLLFNYLIPISLYVTLEFVKFFGTVSVVEDKKMRVEVWKSVERGDSCESAISIANSTNKLSSRLGSKTSMTSSKRVRVIQVPKCNSSDLNEELGQVEVLFSDKTGTLTENRMRFMACSTNGQLYRSVLNQLYLQPAQLYTAPIPNVAKELALIGAHRYTHLGVAVAASKNKSGASTERSSSASEKQFNHREVPPIDKLKLMDKIDEHEELARFFTCLCLCSTITLNETLPLKDCLPDKTNNEYDFQSASPDEESLITASKLYGVTMCKSNEQECYIVIEKSSKQSKNSAKAGSPVFKALVETKNSNDKYIVRHFERLIVLEFSSLRKRMSVIYKDCDTDCIIMVSKGSEELLDCIDMTNMDSLQETCINLTMGHFEAFAKSGLRTLLIALRLLSTAEYLEISEKMKEAKLSIQERDYLTSQVYQQAETKMKLIGTTAVEDTLQEGVPETIESLRIAGVKVWLLTGDKVETAISVAYLCKLLDQDMTLFQLVRQQDVQACRKLLNSYYSDMQHLKEDAKFALIADGRSLHYAMKYSKQELAQLCKQCDCVLGCRLSPLQKSEVVEMVKNSPERPITLAIGDGANDVSMIQEAHVGVGVFGKEGRQAVNSSDFAIGRFSLLNRLLFVHGHLFYNRTSNTIQYFFYKNILFILPQFLFSFYNPSFVSTLYHPILLIGYNLFFTSLPVLLYGLFEVHIPEGMLETYPALYKINRGSAQLSIQVFLTGLLIGAFQSLIGFYLLYFIWHDNQLFLERDEVISKRGFSFVLYFVIVATASIRLFNVAKSHSLYFNLSIIASCLLLPLFLYCYSLINW